VNRPTETGFDAYWREVWQGTTMPAVFDNAMREVALNAWKASRKSLSPEPAGDLAADNERFRAVLKDIAAVDAKGAWWAWIPKSAESALLSYNTPKSPETKEAKP